VRINFTTINEAGEKRDWSMTPNELQEAYWSEDGSLPDLDEKIVSCEVEDINFNCFEDLVTELVGAID